MTQPETLEQLAGRVLDGEGGVVRIQIVPSPSLPYLLRVLFAGTGIVASVEGNVLELRRLSYAEVRDREVPYDG